ncbi:Quaternary ammonium compound-resistance protein SugE [BD1-7 clade bacterium]|uniref:Guanidinium exporter n=1 Tax=BD1-7 clade bacterium TaxID=2029982 RepID=A0A5S9NKA8_9GAMM|nr:Quaternary ammonium compound-resistance protein SugE [BD1-7 clade bacterium]CAA0093461.1 Quaternary ammonium compound-resistance protein SugE [BD1-7 clade bacterium]
MSWIILLFAGLFEIGWAIGLKYSDGFTRLYPSIFTVVSMAISLGLLSLALKQLPLGTAYAIWVGIGAVGTAIAGMVWLGESVTPMRLISLVLVVVGLAGLKLSSVS